MGVPFVDICGCLLCCLYFIKSVYVDCWLVRMFFIASE